MSIMTATPHVDSHERHHVASPQRTPASTRGDSSTPHAYPYSQKHVAERMEHWSSPGRASLHQSRHMVRANNATPRDCAYATDEMTRGLTTNAESPTFIPSPPWQGKPYQFPAGTGSGPSLGWSMRFSNSTATRGLKGAFSWSTARSVPPHRATPTDGAVSLGQSHSALGALPISDERSKALPGVPDRPPALTESDIILRSSTSTGKLHPAMFSPERPRVVTWEEESVRLPPIRLDPHRTSPGHSPDGRAAASSSQRAGVQLPSFPDFIQGNSSPAIGSRASFGSCRGTASPPLSPSPSAASFSSGAYSSDHTDTEPTDEEDADDAAMGGYKRCGSLPPPTVLHPSRSAPRRAARVVSPRDPRELSPVRRSPLTDDEQSVASDSPMSPSSRTDDEFSDVDMDDDARASHQGLAARRGHSSKSDDAAHEFRFVASKLSRAPPEVLQRGRPPVAQRASRCKHAQTASPSPASSEDVPLSSLTWVSSGVQPKPDPEQPQPKPVRHFRTIMQHQPKPDAPKRRGRPPRPAYDVDPLTPLDPDSPEAKGQFPEYRYEGERGLMPCAFEGCATQLTGKKAEMTTHLKEHFQTAGGRTLRCPWMIKGRHGQQEPCNLPFRDSANMGRHVTTRHARVEGYHCGRCGRPFTRRDAALRHMKTMCSPDKQTRKTAKKRSEIESEDEDEERKVSRLTVVCFEALFDTMPFSRWYGRTNKL
ncbi:hypothetical protein BD413DRAFT_199269 [Trametes elegans]|nr:hypothetical protein BD413DRAFT_199269 [Trametes elegans]